MKVYWGDLHCHCGVSYGQGTPQRALDNARQHLDFCSITGHAFWPDMPMVLENHDPGICTHLGGFAKLQYFWRDLMDQLCRANIDGRFVTLPSYEWHSREFGDYNCYFNRYDVELIDGPDPRSLAAKLPDALLIPHHCGYLAGHRGTNWDEFQCDLSPLVEIYSNHGCCEADDAPYDYHHSMGPRSGKSMVREALVAGHRFGFCAGTDSHDGYPGHYGHGRTGVLASRLDRNSIWQALRERRTIASTGARIIADVQLADATIGQVTSYQETMPLLINVEGAAPIDQVEMIECLGGKWQIRRLPMDNLDVEFQPGRYKIKIEMGWGTHGQCSQWDVVAKVTRGSLLGADPCFRYSRYGATESDSSDRIIRPSRNQVEWTCQAAANPAGMLGGTHFDPGGTQAVILDIEASENTHLELTTDPICLDLPVIELAQRSIVQHRTELISPAIKIHRAVPEHQFCYRFAQPYHPSTGEAGFIYLRITQSDGQVAWVSPIWFE